MIRVTQLKKTFGETLAVDGVSFEVPQGQVVGFLGPNGAGKSTTMRMLTTYLNPDEGEIEIAGVDVLRDPQEARRRIGYLPESAPLYGELGVVESLDYCARIRGLSRAKRRDRVAEMIDSCGLAAVTHKDISELSKGYRQRVGLAQTLLHDPEFLILDEPTTGLDPNQIKEIRALIKKIGERRTVILSTHILPEVQATCGRALIISHGQLVADGPPDELMRSGAGHGQRHAVVIRCATVEAVRAILRKIPGVASVDASEDRSGSLGDVVRAQVVGGGATVGEDIYKACVREQWVLRELQPERASLEDVFAALTTGGAEREAS